VIGEQRVPVDIVQLAFGRVRTTLDRLRDDGSVEAEEVVEPFFNIVAGRVSDGLFQLDLAQRPDEARA
jgi:hypothetical protein